MSRLSVAVGLCLEGLNDIEALSQLLKRLSPSYNLEVEIRPHHGYSNLVRFLSQSIRELLLGGINFIVVIADNDRRRPSERINELRQACNVVAIDQNLLVVGIAVQALEAWLLADESAISRVINERVSAVQNPRRIKYPDRKLKEITSYHSRGLQYFDLLKRIVEQLNIDLAARRCRSFRRFRQEYNNKFPK